MNCMKNDFLALEKIFCPVVQADGQGTCLHRLLLYEGGGCTFASSHALLSCMTANQITEAL